MKKFFSSLTINGAIIALLGKILGIDISTGEAGDIIHQVQWLWPVLLAIFADLTTVWGRVKATKFNVPAWQSKVFWSQIASVVLTLAAAFGFDLSAFQGVFEKGLEAWPAILALIGSVVSIVGRFRASKKVSV